MIKDPTHSSPYLQLYEILETISVGVAHDRKRQFKRAVTCYIYYLNKTGDGRQEYFDDPRFFVKKYWDKMALDRFKMWLLDELSRNTSIRKKLARTLSSLSEMMSFAFTYKLIDDEVFPVRIECSSKTETEKYEAYSDREVITIFNAIDSLNRRSINVIKKRPEILKTQPLELDKSCCFPSKQELIQYHSTVLNNSPAVDHNNLPPRYKTFIIAAGRLCGSVTSFYENDLDMHYRLDMNSIMPLLIHLAYYTGLNTESLKSLTIDSLKKEPLTKQYYLHYYKNRGRGEAYLSLSNFSRKESLAIIKIFHQILALTSKIRHLAKDDHKSCLFIYQGNNGRVSPILKGNIEYWLKSFIASKGLKDSNGNELIFNIRRFRKTLITRKAAEGSPIESLQEIANHSDLSTTYRYISENEIRPKFHEAMYQAISNIKKSISEYSPEKHESNTYKTPLGQCTDPYSPPEYISNENNIACSSWNSCLLCPNILLTPNESLPKLIAYHKQIKVALQRGIGTMSHQGEHYIKLDFVISSILKPGVCFTAKEIEKADQDSFNFINHIFDDFVYQGVKL